MERADIEKLFTFTDYSWRLYEETIRPLGDELIAKAAPDSGWPALRDALAHINSAYVRWLADPFATTDEPVDRVTSWDELDAYRRRVRDDARGYLDSLDDNELSTPREMYVDGETLLYSLGENLRSRDAPRAPASRGPEHTPEPARHRDPDRRVPVLAAGTARLDPGTTTSSVDTGRAEVSLTQKVGRP
jgi:hypothetical protein